MIQNLLCFRWPPKCAAKWMGANFPVCCLLSILSNSFTQLFRSLLLKSADSIHSMELQNVSPKKRRLFQNKKTFCTKDPTGLPLSSPAPLATSEAMSTKPSVGRAGERQTGGGEPQKKWFGDEFCADSGMFWYFYICFGGHRPVGHGFFTLGVSCLLGMIGQCPRDPMSYYASMSHLLKNPRNRNLPKNIFSEEKGLTKTSPKQNQG